MKRPPKLAAEAWTLLASFPERPPRRTSSVEASRQALRVATERFGSIEDVPEVRDGLTLGGVAVRIYHPSPGATLPVLIYAHGGGWALGDLDTHDRLCRALAVRAGCAVVSANYRRPPEWPYPAAWQDVQAVLRAIVGEAPLGIDGRRIALGGDSAGGQLALATALRARASGIGLAHLVLLLPDTDIHPERWGSVTEFAEGYGMHPDDQIWYYEQYFGPNWREASGDGVAPLHSDLSALPSTTLVTAECDPVRDEGEALATRLQEAGVQVVLRRYDGMFHPFILFRTLKATEEAEGFVADRLRAAFGRSFGEGSARRS